MSDAYVLDAIRTPFGRYGGALSGVRPDDLAAGVLRALAERNGLDPSTVDEVLLGDANGAGEDNRNVARMAALLAGWPTSVPGATVNRLCGSGVEATMQASRAIQVGDASLVVAGGVESMSRSPLVIPKPDKAFPAGNQTLYNTALGWRMVNPAMPSQWTVSLGESTELLAERYGIGRDEQDAFAARSHVNAARAWDEGFYDDHVVPVEGVELTRDEGIRPDSSPEKLAKLKTVFRKENGTVTAGNASPLNDGASALLLGDAAAAERLGKTPLARIAGRGAAGVDPDVFGIGPVRAAEIALERAGIGWDDLAAVELNEAFAAQSLACLKEWSKLDPEIVNVNGGAIAIGHPLGASGGRIIGTLAHQLRRTGGRWGLAAICIGVGQGLAVVLENR
ncbi:thiolase family protein [Amycolatopsis rubida]|uniref:Probable acetyl-CoA acetyltransferase n=1 Tax=Amycolatopsis rubida TaxID=112413 RepID=A0A1I6BL37_9PSEU|nr:MULTISPECIES: thiolase family protein [Amycolatopsis]MYW95645.1 acetyl-CoA C-acyltransferase [Amycolatopsis rubida]NEC60634.1 thiolase family protein [Amycolatopsis rubida]OAP22423.1 3-oxoadipyl-CoA/3-oxo-5,6-dehydrosuberyl-CoA thiolase [Amycolatopsis sp. M39]SFQ81621.1 acetyl-CoA acetyltransferases [Amycolatopsis rubida]